jgi:2-polyprenyl-3-methyl-5-hydroxy-6-metoxy-1,4-benzoquinol methylase
MNPDSMITFLSRRNENLTEWMDRPDCDPRLLHNTYSQFLRINKLLSGWSGIYEEMIKPVLEAAKTSERPNASILDIGSGGGDILRLLNDLCKRDGFAVEFTGIDPDERAINFVNSYSWPENIRFRQIRSSDLVHEGASFTIVISNHVMHHLSKSELQQLCSDAEKLAEEYVLFSDIERSRLGFAAFSLIAPLLFRNSYIVKDGLISIRRSYRLDELRDVLPDEWNAEKRFPFRLLATFQNKTLET